MSRKKVGIIGGMGPEATVDFMAKIIKNTPVKLDQDHIPLLVDNNSQIPNRIKAILGDGEDPGPVLAKMAAGLEQWGAQLLAMPCNTAHYYYKEIEEAVNIPVLNIIDETIKVLHKDKIKTVGLLATRAVMETKIYHDKLKQANIKLIAPEEKYQEQVVQSILAVKEGDYVKALTPMKEVLNHLLESQVDGIILGCTELPIILSDNKQVDKLGIKLYDTTEILAQAVVQQA